MTSNPIALPSTARGEETLQLGKGEVEHRVMLPDGRLRWIRQTGGLIRDDQGQPMRMLGIVEDVTPRREAESKYAAILQTVQSGFWLLDLEGKLLEVNAACCRMSGYSRNELLHMHISDLEVNETPEGISHHIQFIREHGHHQFESRHRRKDGTLFEVDLRSSWLNVGGGRLVTFIWDISARKKAERTLRASERNLAESNRQKTDILESISDCFYALDKDLRFSYVNSAAEKIWGLARADLIGRKIEDVFGDLIEISMSKFREVLEEQTPQYYEVYSKVIQRWGYMKVCPTSAGISVYFQDITERKQAEANIQKLNRDLERHAVELEMANSELDAFSYSVSHDLRTPLSAIDSFARLLVQEHGSELSPESQRYLGLIRENTTATQRLIQDLLAFSRASRQPLQKQSVSPESIVRESLAELQGALAGRQVEIRIAQLPPCDADPRLLKQVYVNLLSNAFKFTRARDEATVEIGYGACDGEESYYVRDNGVGFDMDQADRLFGVFQRLHAAEEYEGTGVGLAIVERIIRRHGGRVWAESETDKGATFYFIL